MLCLAQTCCDCSRHGMLMLLLAGLDALCSLLLLFLLLLLH
jgi:hypothetical protein